MGKNDFDIDFDFEKEYGFDPNEILDGEEFDENMDISQFSDEELGLQDDLTDQEVPPADDAEYAPEDFSDGDFSAEEYAPEDFDLDALDDLGLDDQTDDIDAFLNMPRRSQPESAQPDQHQGDDEYQQEYPDYQEAYPQDSEPQDYDQSYDPAYEESDAPQQETAQDAPEPKPRRERKPKKPKKEKTGPSLFSRFLDLYFGPVLNKQMREAPVDPDNPRRRRRKSPTQLFKEVYLPPLIVCVSLILVLSFAVGSLSNLIQNLKTEHDRQQSQMQTSQDAAALAEQRMQQILASAEEKVQQYDYNGAIDLLDSLGDLTKYPEVQTKRSEYITAQSQLVEYKDYSMIPNLSFHVLVEDMSRALKDTELKGSYNRNFVTTGEFLKILEQLYNNDYVLVDFDSFIGSQVDPSGTELFSTQSIWLPAGKKPIMLTETMVNYFHYMISDTDLGEANANGDGFANKLVLQNGEIKAQYVSAAGETLVGNYDFVPILEDFISTHPGFVYQGARAILAVTGSQGIFGYRCISDYVATKTQDYVDKEIAGAKEIVQALRDKGYTLACYTYSNMDYKQSSVQQISADLQSWTQKIAPIIGDVDVLVFARVTGLTDYTGQAFKAIYDAGFRYLVANGTEPYAEINPTYVRQNRLMVTGENMVWYSDQFTKNSIFDPKAVIDLATRGEVPKAAK